MKLCIFRACPHCANVAPGTSRKSRPKLTERALAKAQEGNVVILGRASLCDTESKVRQGQKENPYIRGTIYHIMSSGHRRDDIFFDDCDRELPFNQIVVLLAFDFDPLDSESVLRQTRAKCWWSAARIERM